MMEYEMKENSEPIRNDDFQFRQGKRPQKKVRVEA